MPKLNQVLAIEKNIKGRVHGEITSLHQQSQKAQLFNGFTKQYQPKEDGAETFPAENMRVQLNAEDVLRRAQRQLTELIDVTATKDSANQRAAANLVIGGATLAQNVPATTLIFLEKTLTDLQTFVSKLPTLEPDQEWAQDQATGYWKTPPQSTTKTKKLQKAIVLYPATPEHPAQTQLITEDEIVGHWSTVRISGAVKPARKEEILERIETAIKAVKYAREQANNQDAPDVTIGATLLSYVLS